MWQPLEWRRTATGVMRDLQGHRTPDIIQMYVQACIPLLWHHAALGRNAFELMMCAQAEKASVILQRKYQYKVLVCNKKDELFNDILQLITPHTCARGKAIGFVCHLSLSVVSTKIATSRDPGIWATRKHNESVEIGIKLASVCFDSLFFCWPCLLITPT